MLRVPPRTGVPAAEAPAPPVPPVPVVPLDAVHAASPNPAAAMAATHVSGLVLLVMSSLFRDGHACPLGGLVRRARRFHARHASGAPGGVPTRRHESANGPSRTEGLCDALVTVVMCRARPRDTGGMARRVLLVEDDARVRRVLRLALEDEGFSVTEAADGGQCLTDLGEVDPDVVLLDLMLPDTDGFSVCREIRRSSSVPVIMVTARTDSHDVVAGLESGADDYVTKPLVARELTARIRAMLRRV